MNFEHQSQIFFTVNIFGKFYAQKHDQLLLLQSTDNLLKTNKSKLTGRRQTRSPSPNYELHIKPSQPKRGYISCLRPNQINARIQSRSVQNIHNYLLETKIKQFMIDQVIIKQHYSDVRCTKNEAQYVLINIFTHSKKLALEQIK